MGNKCMVLCQFKSVPSLQISVSGGLECPHLLGTEGETLTNGDFLHEWKFSLEKGNTTLFSELLLSLLFLKKQSA